jgi:hypothetical protein
MEVGGLRNVDEGEKMDVDSKTFTNEEKKMEVELLSSQNTLTVSLHEIEAWKQKLPLDQEKDLFDTLKEGISSRILEKFG